MHDPAPEPSVSQLEAKVDVVVAGFKWLLCLLIVFLSVPNFWVALGIFKFQQIYSDALPGKPLPAVTNVLIACPWLFIILSLMLPVVAIANSYFNRNLRVWVASSIAILALIIFQVVLTTIACLMPLQGGLTGVSDQGGH